MRVVYVAGPFRGANSWDMEQNIRRAEELAMEVWRIGLVAFCPHANARYSFGVGEDDDWLSGDLEILERCDAILFTPDWERSSGARTEHAKALEHGIPVFYDLKELDLARTAGAGSRDDYE